MSEILIDCASETYEGKDKQQIDFEFRLSLNAPGKAESPAPDSPEGQEDILKIKFHHSKPVPDDVKEYIANNLGIFDLTEDGDEKTFIFELKINDINIDLIRTVFEKFFVEEAGNAQLAISYSRSQDLAGWLADMRANTDVPFFLHLLEHAQLKAEGVDLVALLDALFKYAKVESPLLVVPWMNLLLMIVSLRLKGVMRSFKKLPAGLFKQMELDQKDNIKDFFYVMDNPINRYIFESGQPGRLQVSGRILNILNYEFNGVFPGLREFLAQVLSW